MEIIGGVLSEISLSEEEADKIEKESKQTAEEYMESDEGRQAIAKAYEEAGHGAPEYLNESQSTNTYSQDTALTPAETGQTEAENIS